MSCEICGVLRNLDRHHVIPKRMGGRKDAAIHDEGNLMTLCRSCHRNLHEGRWDLVRSQDGISVLDKSTGEQVMRRRYKPDLDTPSIFQSLNVAEDSLAQLFQVMAYLSDDQLVEAFNYAAGFGKRSWLVQAAVLYEAQERSIYGKQSLEAIARRFEIGIRQAQKYALVWKVFFEREGTEENVNIDAIVLDQPSWYVVAATETKEPEKWLAYAQDRKQEDPRYSVADFRRDVQQSNFETDGNDERYSDQPNAPLPVLVRQDCPWLRLVCVQSGRLLAIDDCNDCQFVKK
ncbi:MAG: HNH endonuclease signature motif containing protein [Chloroflexi bacterium]|nr:HNH endonuclease signature motif containing protein [Chloroflexota bacterium]